MKLKRVSVRCNSADVMEMLQSGNQFGAENVGMVRIEALGKSMS